MKKICLLTILSLVILSSFKPEEDKDGIIYWIDREEKDVFISVFGARYNMEYEIADSLIERFEKDTITRQIELKSKIGVITGCYDYYDNVNQILVTFCVDKYELSNGDVYYPRKTTDYCSCIGF
jgi:hypothetical protein